MEVGTINPMAYAQVLLSQMGMNINAIPETVLDEVKRKKTKTGVNEVIIPWFTDQKSKTTSTTLGDEAKTLLASLGTAQQSREIDNLRNEIDYQMRNITSSFANIKSAAAKVFEQRTKLDTLLGKPSEGIYPYIQEIHNGGWYKFDLNKTNEENAKVNNQGKSVWFKTPLVVMHIPGKSMNVPMQEYWVQYRPYDSSILVRPTDQAKRVEGYWHPHVGTSGDVCWGNGASAMQRTIKDGNPVYAFEALKVILTTYNDESPFLRYAKFVQVTAPELIKDLPVQWVAHEASEEDRILIHRDNVPEYTQRAYDAYDEVNAEDFEDYDLSDYLVVRPYIKDNGSGEPVDDTYYYKTLPPNSNATYVPIPTSHIEQWV